MTTPRHHHHHHHPEAQAWGPKHRPGAQREKDGERERDFCTRDACATPSSHMGPNSGLVLRSASTKTLAFFGRLESITN